MYVPLAAWLERARERAGRAIVVGLSGAQGSGKSTVCVLLGAVLREGVRRPGRGVVGGRSLPHARGARAPRPRGASPFCNPRTTRHPRPRARSGDHRSVCSRKGRDSAPRCLSFDKAIDDRRPRRAWPVHEGSADYVLFEGWCVGARAQSAAALALPVNAPRARRRCEAALARGGEHRPRGALPRPLRPYRRPDHAAHRRNGAGTRVGAGCRKRSSGSGSRARVRVTRPHA